MGACAGEHAEAGRADDESGDQQDPGPSRGTGADPVVRGLDVVRALGEQRDALEHSEAATDDDQDCGEDRPPVPRSLTLCPPYCAGASSAVLDPLIASWPVPRSWCPCPRERSWVPDSFLLRRQRG